MSSPLSTKFPCPGCDKKYQWTPQVAGKKTQCKVCATVFTLPDTQPPSETVRPPVPPPPSPISIDDDWPPFAPPPADPPTAEPASVLCSACGTPHVWLPEHAGKSFGCSNPDCRQVIVFPFSRPDPLTYVPPPQPVVPPPPPPLASVIPPPPVASRPAPRDEDEPLPRKEKKGSKREDKDRRSKRGDTKDGYILDRTADTRRPMKNYFASRPLWPYVLCAVAAVLFLQSFAVFGMYAIPHGKYDDGPGFGPFLFWGLSLVPVLVIGGTGAAGLFLMKLDTLTDEQADRLIEKDRAELEAAAVALVKERMAQSFGGAVAGALPGLAEPITFRAPTVRAKGEGESEYGWAYGFDGEFRWACSNVMAVGLAGYRAVVVTLSIDHTTGMLYRSNVCEVQYQDVASVETVSTSAVVFRGLAARLGRNRLWGPAAMKLNALFARLPRLLPLLLLSCCCPPALSLLPLLGTVFVILNWVFRDDRSEIEATTFRVTTAGGNTSEVTLDVTYFDTLKAKDSKLNREETREESAVRNRIQEVKTLLRQPTEG